MGCDGVHCLNGAWIGGDGHMTNRYRLIYILKCCASNIMRVI